MATVDAKVVKGVPKCPQCHEKYFSGIHKIEKYGACDGGFWFMYKCQKCSGKKSKVFVKYFTDINFKVISRLKDS
jgi:hypothetical protein